jgi:hypothetical protein
VSDSVTSKTIFNGSRKLIMQFTNLSDGTGESNVVKVDKSTFTGPNGLEPSELIIEMIEGETSGMSVGLSVDHTTDVVLARLGGVGRFKIDYRPHGGLRTNGAGDTGDILFTTNGHSSGDTYNIVLHIRKKD